MKLTGRLLLYWNTVKNLKAVQVKHQIMNRVKRRQKPRRYTVPHGICRVKVFIPELDADEGYCSRFDVEGLMRNEILLLHERHRLTDGWNEPSALHLWNYNLHYLEFLVPLAAEYYKTGDSRYKEKWIEIISSWMENAGKSRDAFEPYTISMRIPNVLAGLEMLGETEDSFEQKLYTSIYEQYQYLQRHLELALLANHYFENLKAVVIGSVLFKEENVYQKYFGLFLKQIDEQILPDGVHYERSLMYHKLILEDVLRVYSVLYHSSRMTDAAKLLASVKVMAEALKGLENGLGRTPLFNDAGDNVSKSREALLAAAEKYCGKIDVRRTVFPDAGYYRLDHGSCAVLFDCGDLGPRYMSGHSQNDCLSFELSIGTNVIFTNSGTGQYQGDLRTYFRSTAAHNTVMADSREQSELWGEHRAARRIGSIRGTAGCGFIAGQYKSCHGDRFRRRLQWKGSSLFITDDIICTDMELHTARQFFHLAPGYQYEWDGGYIRVTEADVTVAEIAVQSSDICIHKDGVITAYAGEFGKYEHKQVLEIRTPFQKSIRITTEIKITGADNG